MLRKKLTKKRFPKSTKRPRQARRRYRKITQTLSNYPVPRSKICRMKYVEAISINAPVGSVGSYTFSANGLYDPNISGVGHQPYGFDQMMAMYNHYQVLGAKITVTATNSQYAEGFIIGIKLDDNGVINATPQYLLEQPYMRRRYISSQNQQPRVTSFFSAKKYFAQKNLKGTYTEQLSGDAANNPADQAYFVIVTAPYTALQDVADIPMLVEIEYIVKLFEPKELPSS